MSPRSLTMPVVVLALTLGGDAPFQRPDSLGGYGGQDPACTEWTDGCAVCRRIAGRPHCSTAGLACTPGRLLCRQAPPP